MRILQWKSHSLFFSKIKIVPPRVEAPEPHTAPNSPIENSSDSSISASDDPGQVLSAETARNVDRLQNSIEKKVYEIAESKGYGHLMEDEPHSLGQWVHGETTNINKLEEIKEDLEINGDHSEWFKDAEEALGAQFTSTPSSPFEEYVIPPCTSTFLCILFHFCLILFKYRKVIFLLYLK